MYALVLSSIGVLSKSKRIADTLRAHLNTIYGCAFVISAINIRSFYLIHGQHLTTIGYKLALESGLTTLVLLSIIIHENRSNPLYILSNSVSYSLLKMIR